MAGCRGSARLVLGLVLGLLAGCRPEAPRAEPRSVRDTLRSVGRRLSREKSETELTDLARHGDRLLAALEPAERQALGRGLIQFSVDRPAIVEIVAPARAVPFWLADRGFTPTGERLQNEDGEFLVYQARVAPGRVELGVNALDRSAPAHYAVYVRPAAGSDGLLPRDLCPPSCRLVRAGAGTSAFADVDRPFQNLPDRLRTAWLIQTRHDERHDGLLLSGRAWKTHVPSSSLPDEAAVSFGSDAARSLTFTWRTGPETRRSCVRLARATAGSAGPAPGEPVHTVCAHSWPIVCDSVLNDPVIVRHRATATGLEPGTLYVYSLGDGSAQGSTAWKTVRTGPASGQAFRFLYLGDAQTGLAAWGDLIQSAVRRHPDVAFLILAGDLVDRGNERTNWDHFFLRAAPVFDSVPLMPAVGNHEYLDQGPRLYRSFFALPSNGPEGEGANLVYAFECGSAFFAVLDSTAALYDAQSRRRQAEWLDAALGQTRATWGFVIFHHPLYASHPNRESPALREAWVPVFDKHRVNLVLQGHDHAYLRTYPLRAGRRVESSETGTTYVVAVSGDKFYGQAARPYIAKGLTRVSTYQVIDVADSRLTYRAYDRGGHEVDAFVIDKPQLLQARQEGPK